MTVSHASRLGDRSREMSEEYCTVSNESSVIMEILFLQLSLGIFSIVFYLDCRIRTCSPFISTGTKYTKRKMDKYTHDLKITCVIETSI
jgi:hypothetical protein